MSKIARRGLSVQATSQAVFGNKSRIYYLMRPGATARRKTVERIRAWIADPPLEEGPQPVAAPPNPTGDAGKAVDEGAGGDRTPPPAPEDQPTGQELAAEIDAFITRTGIRESSIGKLCMHDPKAVRWFRQGRRPMPATVARLRAFMAAPPREAFEPRAPRRFRDPTQQPDTPLMDHAERQSSTCARRSVSHRKAATSEAAKLLDANPEATVGRNGAVTTALNGLKEQRAAEARQTDPVEQAKLALQQKGRTVYASSVVGGPKNRFVVSGMGKDVTPAAMIAEAERVTGRSFRRSAG
jgi:hypothetical protein